MISWQEQQDIIASEAAKFPTTFKLRAWGEDIFSINLLASYWDTGYLYGKPHHEPGPMLYVYIHKDGKQLAFSKGTPEELRREIRS
jgi:hypothetical protein